MTNAGTLRFPKESSILCSANEVSDLTEENGTPNDQSGDEELDDLFLSPEDSEGELVASVDATGEVKAVEDEDGSAESAPSASGASSEELNEALAKVAALEEERDETKNRMMRVAADLENFRKRAAREREDLRKFGIDKVVLELLPVLDNLERALQHAEANAEDNSITEGVRMVYRQFVSALQKHGVSGFESKGEMFDPQRHEAIQQVETDEHETGTVIEQYQKGYFLHDRLIRPAMVSVAKKVTSDTADAAPAMELVEDEPESAPDEAGDEESGVTQMPPIDISPDSDSDEADTPVADADGDEGLQESTDVGT